LPSLPTGTVTFLFTDIEGSTALLQRLGDCRYAEILAEHQRLLRETFAEGNGQEIDTQGDAFLVVFSRARDALATAVAAQRALTKHSWPDGASLRVRMGVHTGEPVSETGGYVGLDVHRAARICSVGHGGQILLSEAVRVLAAPDLPSGVSLRDLGIHRLKDLKEPEHLYQAAHPDLPSAFPAPKTLDARSNNLPIQLTSFIGRAREITEVKRLLAGARFVTLTGSGGAGKTRLALQVAADVVEGYADGVWLAELAPITDPALVPKTVASALTVPEQPGRDMTDTLVDALRTKSLLLVLDNCEHLLAACADLTAALLRVCPQVRILATSREGLGVPGEALWRVPSLSVPEDIRHLPPSEELVLYDAVRLFVDRAVMTAPSFAVTNENAPAVAQVCQRLDGIPLAIELAAARVKVLAVEQIAARLDDRFRLLTGGSRMGLPRHQTLRAAIDWSYQLLSEKERVLLRRLSVFTGGWTLEAAEAVCARGSVEAANVLDLSTSLVDKSLVLAETQGGAARYRLLETVRQYGLDKLLESGEVDDARRQHREWYLGLAEKASPDLIGPRSEVWLDRLEAEHDNLRAALEWSEAEKDGAEPGLRLAGALWWFWIRHGHRREAREWLESALARSAEATPATLPGALAGASNLAWSRGDYGQAETLGEKGLALCRELGDKRGIVNFLYQLGTVCRRRGDSERATGFFNECLNVSRGLGNKWFSGFALAGLGQVAESLRDYERAMALHAESLAEFRVVGDRFGIALALYCVGSAARDLRDYGRAVASFTESLTVCRELGDMWLSGLCLEQVARLASAYGQHQQAARLFGVAEVLHETLGWRLSPIDQADRDRDVASTQGALGDAAFGASWAEGRAMTLEQAIEYALAPESI
jgi:predicted ATPase/class 3 adenylate cyclase